MFQLHHRVLRTGNKKYGLKTFVRRKNYYVERLVSTTSAAATTVIPGKKNTDQQPSFKEICNRIQSFELKNKNHVVRHTVARDGIEAGINLLVEKYGMKKHNHIAAKTGISKTDLSGVTFLAFGAAENSSTLSSGVISLIIQWCKEWVVFNDSLSSAEDVEAVLASLVRLLVNTSTTDAATRLIMDVIEAGHRPRLRTFKPVLSAAMNSKNLQSVLDVYSIMQRSCATALTEVEYTSVITAVLQSSNNDISSNEKDTLISIIENMATDVSFISNDNAETLLQKFAETNSVRAEFTTVNGHTAHCSFSNTTLRKSALDAAMLREMKDGCIDLLQNHSNCLRPRVTSFLSWIQRYNNHHSENGRPCRHVLIDGPNIGHRIVGDKEQRYDGFFRYHAIDAMITKLEADDANTFVSVVMPFRYADLRYAMKTCPHGVSFFSKSENTAIINKWRGKNQMYVVPDDAPDDLYWMIGALALGGSNKTDVSVLTFDAMRDHLGKLERLSSAPRCTRKNLARWRESVVMNASITEENIRGNKFRHGDPVPTVTSIQLKKRPFTRCIQLNKSSTGTIIIHFPITETEGKWLCVVLEQKTNLLDRLYNSDWVRALIR